MERTLRFIDSLIHTVDLIAGKRNVHPAPKKHLNVDGMFILRNATALLMALIKLILDACKKGINSVLGYIHSAPNRCITRYSILLSEQLLRK